MKSPELLLSITTDVLALVKILHRDAHNESASRIFSIRAHQLMNTDLQRLQVRLSYPPDLICLDDTEAKLHLGCGARKAAGWLNVDLSDSDFDCDLASQLPWADQQFKAIVSQHTIEHLDFDEQVPLFLSELHRVSRPGAHIWLSCPDMEKITAAYAADRGASLLEDRKPRWHEYESLRPAGIPPQDIINNLFHQWGEHKGLFDFALLSWCLGRAGFTEVSKHTEADFLASFPDFPPRGDDAQALYVRAIRS